MSTSSLGSDSLGWDRRRAGAAKGRIGGQERSSPQPPSFFALFSRVTATLFPFSTSLTTSRRTMRRLSLRTLLSGCVHPSVFEASRSSSSPNSLSLPPFTSHRALPQALLPFALVGSEEEIEVDGEPVRVRRSVFKLSSRLSLSSSVVRSTRRSFLRTAR